ncbi:hypothetical protein OEZ85_002815 [Tetradesmus obliquus]|uniref:Uncharacterized protein n=1 Tax=Tetradesmus obliquus TaxID=3088 RepID=A0ABY8U2W0_TETOB|nr:hypothetical protein OEZ85_002815 [Tetradesmus obliquus]
MSAAGPDAGLVHQLTTLLLVPTLGQKFKWRKVHATSATFQSPMVAASVTATATVFQEEETTATTCDVCAPGFNQQGTVCRAPTPALPPGANPIINQWPYPTQREALDALVGSREVRQAVE